MREMSESAAHTTLKTPSAAIPPRAWFTRCRREQQARERSVGFESTDQYKIASRDCVTVIFDRYFESPRSFRAGHLLLVQAWTLRLHRLHLPQPRNSDY